MGEGAFWRGSSWACRSGVRVCASTSATTLDSRDKYVSGSPTKPHESVLTICPRFGLLKFGGEDLRRGGRDGGRARDRLRRAVELPVLPPPVPRPTCPILCVLITVWEQPPFLNCARVTIAEQAKNGACLTAVEAASARMPRGSAVRARRTCALKTRPPSEGVLQCVNDPRRLARRCRFGSPAMATPQRLPARTPSPPQPNRQRRLDRQRRDLGGEVFGRPFG